MRIDTPACLCFKPYYNWNAFNTKNQEEVFQINLDEVLNLIISGLPSIQSTNTGSCTIIGGKEF